MTRTQPQSKSLLVLGFSWTGRPTSHSLFVGSVENRSGSLQPWRPKGITDLIPSPRRAVGTQCPQCHGQTLISGDGANPGARSSQQAAGQLSSHGSRATTFISRILDGSHGAIKQSCWNSSWIITTVPDSLGPSVPPQYW